MKRVLTPLAAACCLALTPLVQAAPYSGLVVFGDSLSDAGQFPDPADPTGSTLRFTNRTGLDEAFGPTAPMLLGGKLGLGGPGLGPSTSPVFEANGWEDGNNWAVGGYRTDQIYDSIVAKDGSVVDGRTRNGYLYDRGFKADARALYYLTGGGNDFLQNRVLTPGQASNAAKRFANSAQALQQAGARYIMVWLLPDISRTPAAAIKYPHPVIKDYISQLSQAYNEALVTSLEGIDAEIIPLNVPLMLSEVMADPGRYGLAVGLAEGQALDQTCFSGDNCTENSLYGISKTGADPAKLLFNDGVHPTIAGQTLISDYAYSLLSAPHELSLLPEMAQGVLRAHQDQLRSQWLADWEAWQAVGQVRTFVTGSGQQQDFDAQSNSADADGDGYGLNLGASYRLSEAWRVGLGLGLDEQELDAGESDYELRSYLLSAFAQFQHNRWWADATASAGKLDYDNLERSFDLGVATRTEKGDSDGDLWAVSGRLGYDIAQPGNDWHLSPFISADYARVEVDGYSETGVGSTALTFGDQERSSKRLGVGLQGRYALSPSTQLFAEVAHEREYEDDAQKVDIALNSLPTLDFTLLGYTPDGDLDRVSLGFNQQLTADLALRGGYSLRKSEDDTQQGVNLSLAWDW